LSETHSPHERQKVEKTQKYFITTDHMPFVGTHR